MQPLLSLSARRFLALTMTALFAFGLTGCNDDDDPATPQQNIVQLAQGNANLSLLVQAVVRAGLDDELSAATTNGYTVFAPTNTAFEEAGFTSSVIAATAPADLAAILLYHVLPTEYTAAALSSAEYATLATGSETVRVSKVTAGVFVNGNSEVTTADVDASNGVVHVIDAVILPPAGNIVEIAQETDAFSYLVAAVVRAGLTDELSDASANLTVFAPTNAAFIAAGYETISEIESADAEALADILLYHVVNNRVFSPEVPNSSTVATLAGGNLTTTASPVTVRGIGNGAAVNVTTPFNVTATNGVIHTIGTVLLPTGGTKQ